VDTRTRTHIHANIVDTRTHTHTYRGQTHTHTHKHAHTRTHTHTSWTHAHTRTRTEDTRTHRGQTQTNARTVDNISSSGLSRFTGEEESVYLGVGYWVLGVGCGCWVHTAHRGVRDRGVRESVNPTPKCTLWLRERTVSSHYHTYTGSEASSHRCLDVDTCTYAQTCTNAKASHHKRTSHRHACAEHTWRMLAEPRTHERSYIYTHARTYIYMTRAHQTRT
jgi:hypothetical protein